MFIGLVTHVFQQLNNSQTTLAETSNNKRAGVVSVGNEVVERLLYITHRKCSTTMNSVFIESSPCIKGYVTIIWSIEIVTLCHIFCYFLLLYSHVVTVFLIPHISIVAFLPIGCCPVKLPCGNNIKDISTRAVSIIFGNIPHSIILIIRSLRNNLRMGRGNLFPLTTVSAVLPIAWLHEEVEL